MELGSGCEWLSGGYFADARRETPHHSRRHCLAHQPARAATVGRAGLYRLRQLLAEIQIAERLAEQPRIRPADPSNRRCGGRLRVQHRSKYCRASSRS
jgi:hypothetical protein